MDKNIEDIRKLMETPNPGTGGADPSEDQKAWGELLKLLEDERKNLDSAAGSGTPAPAAPNSGSHRHPGPPSTSGSTTGLTPAPSAPPAEPAQPTPPADDNPPANTDNGGN